MKRKEALDTVMAALDPNDAIISTTGLISREIFERFDSERNIYVPGSMGLASSIGLGLAVSQPPKRIIIIDGDASLLMNLGSIVTIGHMQPYNLLHIVFDNGAYASCSEERSMSNDVDLGRLAQDCGYNFVRRPYSERELKCAILSFKQGPGFILAKINLGGRRDFKRPLNLVEIKTRFMQFFIQPNQYKGEKL